MSVKKSPKDPVQQSMAAAAGSNINKWGKPGAATKAVLPSGKKLVFDEDSDAILLFLGMKDISDKIGEAAGSVIYYTFHDGKTIVSMPNSYKLKEMEFKPYSFYYLRNAGNVQTTPGFNPMKDFEIVELGVENEEVKADSNRTGTPTITLTLDTIRELNYMRLNYPLRPTPKLKE